MDLTYFSAIIFGLVQGVTEFLPVSSSGHLALVPQLFALEDPGVAFFVALHFGTLFAVIGYFWNDWMNIFGLRSDMPVYQKNRKMLLHVFVATVPAVAIGMFFVSNPNVLVGSPLLIATFLFIGGGLLYFADVVGKRERDLEHVNLRDAALIGFAQIFALIPGISRSGITIAAARLLHINRVDAARFSFLLSAPVILGANVAQLPALSASSTNPAFWIGVLVSFLSAYFAIKYFLALIRRVSYAAFFWYSVVLMGLFIFAHLFLS